jgi:hypothetical protein
VEGAKAWTGSCRPGRCPLSVVVDVAASTDGTALGPGSPRVRLQTPSVDRVDVWSGEPG